MIVVGNLFPDGGGVGDHASKFEVIIIVRIKAMCVDAACADLPSLRGVMLRSHIYDHGILSIFLMVATYIWYSGTDVAQHTNVPRSPRFNPRGQLKRSR